MKSLAFIFFKGALSFSLLFTLYFALFGLLGEVDLFKTIIAPSVFFSAVLLLVHFGLSQRLGARENFSVRQQVLIKQDFILTDVKEMLFETTPWRCIKESEETLTFKAGWESFRSFGEIIEISKVDSGLLVRSQPTSVTTLFDYGKNFQNVMKVREIIGN